jgi:hypothetical protein
MLTKSKEAINSSDANNSRDVRAETLATAGAERNNSTKRPTTAQETAGALGLQGTPTAGTVELVETPVTEATAGTPEMLHKERRQQQGWRKKQ